MMSENEQKDEKRKTVADVVAIVRRAAQYYEDEAEKSEGLLRESFKLSAANYREIANRIEAAWKREKAEWEAAACACVSNAVISGRVAVEHPPVGNAAAMREALEDIIGIAKVALNVNSLGNSNDSELWDIIDKCKSALAAPLRNCDVGTAEEQYRRHDKFCDETRNGMSGYNCEDAPRCVYCFAKWAQMPYEAEEGGPE